MGKEVRVVFNADTGDYVAEVDRATGATIKQAEAAAMAKNLIKQSLKERTQAAVEAGASERELERIYSRAARESANVTEDSAKRKIASLERYRDEQVRIAAELKVLGAIPNVADAAGEGVSAKLRASAVLRGGGLRAGEAFLSQFSAFNKVSQLVFPVLGAAQLAKELYHGYEALQKMYDTAEKLPDVLQDGFEKISQPLETATDKLRVVNDTLDLAHEKFNGYSTGETTLALKLDEARVHADELAKSAANAFEQVQKLLGENQLGYFESLLTGKGETKDLSTGVTDRFQHLKDLGAENLLATRSGHDAPDAQAARNKAIADARAEFRKYLTDYEAKLNGSTTNSYVGASGVVQNETVSYAQKYGDQTDNKRIITGTQNLLNDQDEQAATQAANKDKVVAGKVDQQKAAQRQKALEQARTAQAKQAQQWDDEHAAWEAAAKRSTADEAYFWAMKSAAAKEGSKNFLMAWRKSDGEIAKIRADSAKKGPENDKLLLEMGTSGESKTGVELDNAGYESQNKAIESFAKSLFGLADAQQKQKDSAAELAIGENLRLGRISKLDAATQMQQLHTQQYTDDVGKLKDELAGLGDSLGDKTLANGLNQKLAVLDTKRLGESMKDAAAVAGETWQSALSEANAHFVQNSRDSAGQVKAIYSELLQGTNANLLSLITNEHTNFSGQFQGLGKNIAGIGLNKVESSVLGKFGLAKADGQKGNPLHVFVENQPAGSGSATAASALGNLFPTTGSDKLGSTLSSIAKNALGFIPGGSIFAGLFGGHRALGGGVKAGISYDVGELGRETFTPSTDGVITPNNKLGGGAAHYTINVGGGVTPEQVHQQVSSALRQVHGQVVRDATQAMSEKMARRPRSAGY